MSNSSTSTPQAHEQGQFFKLPGEIRNMIYGFVLSNPAGLCYRRNDNNNVGRLYDRTNNTTSHVSNDREAHQLQYICHDLRNETRAHGLRIMKCMSKTT
ncbi:hypothetical protein CC86DRAFT_98827 [Ophiobolus disseminans]|uniref:Uncharacterized protein n=1 Tax=Ophiobolus disseminans TaxID=1469910 RepID=A0A6A6ZLT5_9PLEO|nr:hypothetical protein CC86DRAFT_98827 [Ophiobolus disseminans]